MHHQMTVIFAHATTTWLTCHVRYTVAITFFESVWQQKEFSIEFKLRLVEWALGCTLISLAAKSPNSHIRNHWRDLKNNNTNFFHIVSLCVESFVSIFTSYNLFPKWNFFARSTRNILPPLRIYCFAKYIVAVKYFDGSYILLHLECAHGFEWKWDFRLSQFVVVCQDRSFGGFHAILSI